MQKIISLFQRNYETDRLVRDEITPGAEWVINGEGMATRKWDGMALLYKDGEWFKRHDAKAFTIDGNKKRNYNRKPPPDFIPVQDPDPVTGHWPGWVPCSKDKPEDTLIFITGVLAEQRFANGTYELVGPKVGTRGGSNPEKLQEHLIIKHGDHILDAPRTFDELKYWFGMVNMEGIVWHHPDGRMVKIKKKDFGYKW